MDTTSPKSALLATPLEGSSPASPSASCTAGACLKRYSQWYETCPTDARDRGTDPYRTSPPLQPRIWACGHRSEDTTATFGTYSAPGRSP
jgi:hypothetical protein